MTRSSRAAWLGVAALLAAHAPQASSAAPREQQLRHGAVRVGNVQRTFAVYVPAGAGAGVPAVLVLHGGSGGSGQRIRGFIGAELERFADEHTFLVVYPDGIGGSWNDCRAGAAYPARRENADDVGFLRALIAHLADAFAADRRRVHALGFSNGGHLAFRVILEAPGLVAGIAAFGANLPARGALDCEERRTAAPVFLVTGTADPVNPFDGGTVVLPDGTSLGAVRSAHDTLSYFGDVAGHLGPPGCLTVPGAREAVNGVIEAHGWTTPGRAPVALYVVRGGGHTIPSPTAAFPDVLGPVERRLSGVEAALRFFGLR